MLSKGDLSPPQATGTLPKAPRPTRDPRAFREPPRHPLGLPGGSPDPQGDPRAYTGPSKRRAGPGLPQAGPPRPHSAALPGARRPPRPSRAPPGGAGRAPLYSSSLWYGGALSLPAWGGSGRLKPLLDALPARAPLSPQPGVGAAAAAPREARRDWPIPSAAPSSLWPRPPSLGNAPSLWSRGRDVAAAAGPRPGPLLAAPRPPRLRRRPAQRPQPQPRAVSAARPGAKPAGSPRWPAAGAGCPPALRGAAGAGWGGAVFEG